MISSERSEQGKCQDRTLYLAKKKKKPFRNKGKIETFLAKQNQKICHQGTLKRLLQEGKEGLQIQLGYAPKKGNIMNGLNM